MTNRRHALTALALLAAGPVRAGPGHATPHGPVKKEQTDWGIAGDAKAAKRTVQISMLDSMRFSPDSMAVKLGETIRLVVKNTGVIGHELVVGTQAVLDKHAALMAKFPTMEHDEPYMVHVGPGETGSLVWTFNRPGSFDFACLIPGHYQAGMVGKITVAAK
jgi:uncharacterized cupredoxin-like copper-binding protein